jgi:hypothetical protein
VEITRGALVQVTPTSYGVHSEEFHFWSGPIGHPAEYENYAESTTGKGGLTPAIPEDDGDTASVRSVESANTHSEAARLHRLAETGETVFTLPVAGV